MEEIIMNEEAMEQASEEIAKLSNNRVGDVALGAGIAVGAYMAFRGIKKLIYQMQIKKAEKVVAENEPIEPIETVE